MLNTLKNDAATLSHAAEPERTMNSITFKTVEPILPWTRPARPWRDGMQAILLLVFIVTVTCAVLLLLDHAGIHLPATEELLAVSPAD